MNTLVCNRPGCVSLVAYDGARYCAVHGSDLTRARQCERCHGSGWQGKDMPCDRCSGTGLLDKRVGQSHYGRARKEQKVDERGLITAAEREA